MAASRISKFVMLFEPENSLTRHEATGKTGYLHQSNPNRYLVSVKAVVWVVISIFVGLGIGQL